MKRLPTIDDEDLINLCTLQESLDKLSAIDPSGYVCELIARFKERVEETADDRYKARENKMARAMTSSFILSALVGDMVVGSTIKKRCEAAIQLADELLKQLDNEDTHTGH